LASWSRLVDCVEKGALHSWRSSLAAEKPCEIIGIESALRGANAEDWSLIECGDSSAETLSCIILDAILACCRKAPASNSPLSAPAGLPSDIMSMHDIGTLLAQAPAATPVTDELCALSSLFRMEAPTAKREGIGQRDPGRLAERRRTGHLEPALTKIYPYSGVYLGWYTQIRELVFDYPELAPNLRVAALPGGGITGDWYLGVVKGSVSVALGQRIIEILCGRDQDNRRFIEGVGLPTHKAYRRRGIYKAWPRAEFDLATVLDIHAGANARSRVPGYSEARSTLGALGEQVKRPLGDEKLHKDSIRSFVRRLGDMVTLVTGDRPGTLPDPGCPSGKRA
jgi:hypothetical protein